MTGRSNWEVEVLPKLWQSTRHSAQGLMRVKGMDGTAKRFSSEMEADKLEACLFSRIKRLHPLMRRRDCKGCSFCWTPGASAKNDFQSSSTYGFYRVL